MKIVYVVPRTVLAEKMSMCDVHILLRRIDVYTYLSKLLVYLWGYKYRLTGCLTNQSCMFIESISIYTLIATSDDPRNRFSLVGGNFHLVHTNKDYSGV